MRRWSRRLATALALLAALGVTGCENLFEFAAPDDSATSLVQDGDQALRDSDYEEAIRLYRDALAEDPNDAEAHWGLSKALIRQTSYTTLDILSEVSRMETSSDTLPFMDEDLHPAPRADSLYQAVQEINDEHLNLLFNGIVFTEALDSAAVALDYAGTLAVEAILLFRDTDVDGDIDGDDLNLAALFDDLGSFQLDSTAWSNANQDSLEAQLNSLLSSSLGAMDVVLGQVSDDSLETGFDTDNMDEAIGSILSGFGDFSGGGGGGLLASPPFERPRGGEVAR